MSNNQYVTFEALDTILEQFSENLMKGEEKLEDARIHALTAIVEELNYCRLRDIHFIMNILSSIGYGPIARLQEYYNAYCDEFDKLNKKEVQDESKTDSE